MLQRVIGVSLGYNTAAAIVHPHRGVEFAIQEERLNGEKNTKQFPIKALKMCVDKVLRMGYDNIVIGISSYEVINDRTMKYMPERFKHLRSQFENFYDALHEHIRIECNIPHDVGLTIKRVEHHEAHRLPAIYLSGFLQDTSAKTIAITADGFGEGVSATIYDCQTDELLAREYIDTSLGLVYQFVTGALGFKEHQHEGKVTGLAGYGEPKYAELFKDALIGYDPTTIEFRPNYLDKFNFANYERIELNKNIHDFKNLIRMKEYTRKFVEHIKKHFKATKEDIAASVQKFTEDLMISWIKDTLSYNNINDNFNIVVSGGLFANSKINYKIKKEVNPKQLFVLPCMGDEGTAIGAAIKVCTNLYGRGIMKLESFGNDNLYPGRVIPESRFPSVTKLIDLNKFDVISGVAELMYLKKYEGDIAKPIAEALSEGKVVAISRGYMEFGPRALCNHSILFDASNKELGDKLTKVLDRNEFMPYAPVTIDKFANDLFEDLKGLEKATKYMSISLPAKQEFKDNYPAALHVDQTALPQIVYQEDNSLIYRIIEEFHNLTGKKAIVNTSFNQHGKPIVFEKQHAFDIFEQLDLDVLLLDDRIIVKRER